MSFAVCTHKLPGHLVKEHSNVFTVRTDCRRAHVTAHRVSVTECSQQCSLENNCVFIQRREIADKNEYRGNVGNIISYKFM